MADGFNTVSSAASKDEWLTPPEIIRALGEFDLDPCAPHKNKRPWPTAKQHYSGMCWQEGGEDVCGLRAPWHGRVWLNPPYGKETFKWMAKLAEHRRGIGLIFARTDTKGFHEHIFKKARSVFFMEGRINFYHVSGKRGQHAGNAPSCLVAYSDADTLAIASSGLRGRLCFLGNGYADDVA